MENKKYVPLIRLTMAKERELPYQGNLINSPESVADFARQVLKGADREYLLVISVSVRCKPLALEIVSIGTVDETVAEPREIFKHAILNNAAGIILVHNHPSGDCEPSEYDKALTKRVEKAGVLLGVRLYDHVIIGEGHYSFREHRELEE